MDLWCVHAKSNAFLLRNSFSDKPNCWTSKNYSMNPELPSSKPQFLPTKCRHPSVSAMAKRSAGNSSSSNSNSPSSNSGGNDDNLKSGGDSLKGNNYPRESKNSDESNPRWI